MMDLTDLGKKKAKPEVQKRKLYRVTEIFTSIQGEGAHTGVACVFVRFAGCNLSCDFCDTEFPDNHVLNLKGLLKMIMREKIKRVVFTGGEPSLQVDLPLMQELHSRGYVMHMETNGTNIINPTMMDGFSWLTVSPKPGAMWLQKKGEELKVVWKPGMDLTPYQGGEFAVRCIQPMDEGNGPLEHAKAAALEVQKPEYAARWRVSLQTHKMIGVE